MIFAKPKEALVQSFFFILRRDERPGTYIECQAGVDPAFYIEVKSGLKGELKNRRNM